MLIDEINKIGIRVRCKEEGDELIAFLSKHEVLWQNMGPVTEGSGLGEQVHPLTYLLRRLPNQRLQLSWIMPGWEERSKMQTIIDSKEFISKNR